MKNGYTYPLELCILSAFSIIDTEPESSPTPPDEDEDSARFYQHSHHLIDGGVVGIFQWKLNGGIIDANDTFLRIIGYSRDELEAGRIDWVALTPPEWRAIDAQRAEEILRGGSHEVYEKEYIRKDGTRVPILVGNAFFESSKEGGISFILDISQQKKAEREREAAREDLEQSMESLRLALEAGKLGSFALNLSTGRMHCTAQCKANFGLPSDAEVTYDMLFALLYEEDRLGVRAAIEQALRDHADYTAEYRIHTPDGQTRWIAARGRAVYGGVDGETPLQIIGVTQDVSISHWAQEALRRSEARYRRLLETAQEGILFLDAQGRIAHTNPQFAQMLGYDSASELIGQEAFFLFFAEDVELAREKWAMRLMGTQENYELRLRARDNTERWFIAHVTVEVDEDTNAFQGTFTLLTDITERRRIEQELAARNEEIATVFERVTDAFAAFDLDFNFTYLNSGAERILGYPSSELIGHCIWDVFPDGRNTLVYREYLRAQREQIPVVFEVYYGPLFGWFEVRAYPSPTGLSAYFRNITELKEAERVREEALDVTRETEERLRLALASGDMGTWDADIPSGTMTLSENIPPLYGKPGVPMTVTFSEWISWLHPNDQARVPAAFAAALRGETDYDVQFRTLWADGVTYRWVATRALITRDAHGVPIRAVGYIRDITQEREREAEREALVLRQRRFLHEMVSSLTEGKFRLCLTSADLPKPLSPASEKIVLTVPTLRLLRKKLNAVTAEMGFTLDRAQDIETGVGEAIMNAATHGGGGEGWICTDSDCGIVQVWVRDSGKGISEEALPRVLEKGMSTAGTLGHGFWLMLRTCDRVYLFTGPGGTTVVLEMHRAIPEPAWLQAVTI